MCLCRVRCAKSSHHVALCVPCSFPRSQTARRPQAAPPAAAAAPFHPRPAPHSMLLRLQSNPRMHRHHHAHVPHWRQRHATHSRSSRTRIRRTTRSPTASTFARINRPMSMSPSPSIIPIARRPRRPSSIWAPLWLWVPLVALSFWLRLSPPSSSWSEGECYRTLFYL